MLWMQFYSMTRQMHWKSVREELKCGDVRQTAATAEPEELPDQVLDFISMLQEE